MENDVRPDEAAAALGLVSSSRAELADRLVTPWWYHPALGLLAALLVVGYSAGGTAVRFGALVVFVTVTAALVAAYRRLTGVWVSGSHPGPARRYAVATGVLLGGLLLAGLGLHALTGRLLPVLGLAALALVGTVVLGRRYDVALRDGLRAGSAP